MLNAALGYSNCLINISHLFSRFSEILQYDPISCILFAYCTQVHMFPCEPARRNQRSKSGVFSKCCSFTVGHSLAPNLELMGSAAPTAQLQAFHPWFCAYRSL